MWNTITKYDVIKLYWFYEDDFQDEEMETVGEVIRITEDEIVVRDKNGEEHVVKHDDFVDVDHLSYADRNEIYRH
jgi:hypothetical protein